MVLNLPNLLTFSRIAVIPILVALFWVEGNAARWVACALFTAAGITDYLDGYLARTWRAQSQLGALLDPIADKLLVFAALVVLVVQHRIPLWLILLLGGQNLLMILGAGMVKWKNLEIPTSPSRIGKYATFTLICLVVLALVTSSERAPRALHAYVPVLAFISALCVVISTIQYFARFGYLWFEPARPR